MATELPAATPDGFYRRVNRTLVKDGFRQVNLDDLRALRAHGLLKERHLGIDSSVIEANASLRALQHRNSENRLLVLMHRSLV